MPPEQEEKNTLVIIDRLLEGRFGAAFTKFTTHIRTDREVIGATITPGMTSEEAQALCSTECCNVVLYCIQPWVDKKVRIDRHAFEFLSSVFIPTAIMVDGRGTEFFRSHEVTNIGGNNNSNKVQGIVGNLQMSEANYGVTLPDILVTPKRTSGIRKAIQTEYITNFDLLTQDQKPAGRPPRPRRGSN